MADLLSSFVPEDREGKGSDRERVWSSVRRVAVYLLSLPARRNIGLFASLPIFAFGARPSPLTSSFNSPQPPFCTPSDLLLSLPARPLTLSLHSPQSSPARLSPQPEARPARYSGCLASARGATPPRNWLSRHYSGSAHFAPLHLATSRLAS